MSEAAITGTDGTVYTIFNRQQEGALATSTMFGGTVSNLSAATDTYITSADAVSYQNNTTYYVADHLGTAQMEFTGGGWPVWKGEFAPYGQEIGSQSTASQYKFTGLERDSESNLDHSTFRQYSSNIGRWMSPDPYNGSYDLSNPQSLNRYSYVGNMPLGFTDPSGLEGGSSCDFACAVVIAADTVLSFGLNSVFSKPQCLACDHPRPNGQIWDEYHIHYGPDIPGALGLPGGGGCEFGACGFISPGQDAGRVGKDVGAWAAGYALDALDLLLYTPANREAPRRFFGTYYCGPGGRGPTGGIINGACVAHDTCFTNAGIDANGNTHPEIPWSFSQVIAASNCNQTLYNTAKQYPNEIGSAGLQFWLRHGDMLGILRRGTAVVP